MDRTDEDLLALSGENFLHETYPDPVTMEWDYRVTTGLKDT